MRTLGIDFGERRIGLAISDPEGRTAVPLTTLERRDDRSAIASIAELALRERVERLVLGEPLGLDGVAGPAAQRVRSFARKLRQATGLACDLVPETLTTVEAQRRLQSAGLDPRRSPHGLDAVAAQVLLEEALRHDPTGDAR